MDVDYRDAARRHWDSAGQLEGVGHHATADHLYGLAAECALKAAMVLRGAPTSASGDLQDRNHRLHIDELWSEFQTFMSGRRGARLRSLRSFTTNPFFDWNVAQRYASNAAAPGQRVAQSHRRAAHACLTAMERCSEDL